jgi:hypothetical protein
MVRVMSIAFRWFCIFEAPAPGGFLHIPPDDCTDTPKTECLVELTIAAWPLDRHPH